MSVTLEAQVPALSARDLGFRVGGLDIITGISLSVPPGHFLGIIGPNGAGKSTLLNLLSGVLRPTAGEIELAGRVVTHTRPAARARRGLGRTFQTSSLFNGLSAYENVRLAAQAHLGGSARFYRPPRARDAASVSATRALEQVGLADQALRLTGLLSHGDKRKVELAVLLASQAEVLLLDEPMAGVTADDVDQLSALIGGLHRDGHTVLMVEHHMSVVVGLAQTIAVLDAGQLLALGTPAEVVANETVQQAYLGQPL